jgi:hypothetical protein
MRSAEIQEMIYNWALAQNFTAPYGVLQGQHTNTKGRPYLSVTFGRARTLDVSVDIYNKNFILMRSNRTGTQVYRSVDSLMSVLRQI